MFNLNASCRCSSVNGRIAYSHSGAGTTISGSAANVGTKKLRIVSKTAISLESRKSRKSGKSQKSKTLPILPRLPRLLDFLDYQHAVPVAIKPVALSDGMPVSIHYKFV